MTCLIVIYDCVGTYNETIIMVGMSTSFLNSLSHPCPCPSVPPRIFTTLIFQVYTYDWVMLLIILSYDGVMLVWMTLYTDEDSVTNIRDDVGCEEK